jgi:hypothetical protein
MAGDKLIAGKTVSRNGSTGGFPLVTVETNGKVEKDDEWALFRLTDRGIGFWRAGPDFRAGIMSLEISGQRAVREIPGRFRTEEDAVTAHSKLSDDEKARTLVRSVRPKK